MASKTIQAAHNDKEIKKPVKKSSLGFFMGMILLAMLVYFAYTVYVDPGDERPEFHTPNM